MNRRLHLSGVVGGPVDIGPLEPEAGPNILNLPGILEFGGSIIKAFNYFLLILRPYYLNGTLF